MKVTVTANYDRWIAGFGRLGPEVAAKASNRWRQATEVFFERTQQFAHVWTGEMKASGHAEIEVTATEVIGRVEYDSEHAVFEEQRGGEHALITRGWEATEEMFAQAMPQVWDDVVRSWG